MPEHITTIINEDVQQGMIVLAKEHIDALVNGVFWVWITPDGYKLAVTPTTTDPEDRRLVGYLTLAITPSDIERLYNTPLMCEMNTFTFYVMSRETAIRDGILKAEELP